MNLENLDNILEKEPRYRKDQAMTFIFKNFINDWKEAMSLPKTIREELTEKCPLDINAETFFSKDKNTIKAVVVLENSAKVSDTRRQRNFGRSVLANTRGSKFPDNTVDGAFAEFSKIETVLMRHKDGRNTVCVSCQVGCPVGCKFCATGKMGFKRNLTMYEILEQILFFERYLKPQNERVSNVTFMGMGEPMLNYDNVLAAIRILNNDKFFNIGARHISISTSGITEGIEKLSDENLQINLAISLHSPKEDIRESIMPMSKTYTIEKILNAVEKYIEKTNRRVMFEYLLLDGINDSEEDALALAQLLKNHLYFVNLISYNSTGNFKPSSSEKVKIFKETLSENGIEVTQRYRFGRGIKAACGQLVTKSGTKGYKQID